MSPDLGPTGTPGPVGAKVFNTTGSKGGTGGSGGTDTTVGSASTNSTARTADMFCSGMTYSRGRICIWYCYWYYCRTQ